MITLQNPTVDALNNRLWYTDTETQSKYFLEVGESYVQLYAFRQGISMAMNMDYFDFQEPVGHSYTETFARHAIQRNRENHMKMAG